MRRLGDWLAQLGLAKYEAVLTDRQIDLAALRLLSDQDLAALGIALGPRRKMLSALGGPRPLPDAAKPDKIPVATPSPLQADMSSDHRQLTVMFVDLVGWSDIAERLEADLLPELLGRYHETTCEIIHRHEGHVAQFLGDGVLVYFGYPPAHEDDAERCVRAALEIVAGMQALSAALETGGLPRLPVRVGIHTGLAVVGNIGRNGRNEVLAVGSAPSVAARIQALAASDSVLISAATRTLVARHFRYADLGRRALHGLRTPVRLYCVRGPRAWSTRFQASRRTALTPLVGREPELALLVDRWRLVREGSSQIVSLVGEPGIGKSRLVSALCERVNADVHSLIVLQCLPQFVNSPLHPVIEYAERALGFEAGDCADVRLDRIEAWLLHRHGRSIEDARLLAAMLSLPFEARYGPLQQPPARRRVETARMLFDTAAALAGGKPILLVVEDVHWADPTTVELLLDVAARMYDQRAMMLISHRPEFSNARFMQFGANQVALERLSLAQASAFVGRFIAPSERNDAVARQIVARSDGVPLFLEEICKAVLESMAGDGPDRRDPAAIAIPATLRDSLMSRLDRVPDGRLIAQVGAVLGREFSEEMVVSLAGELGLAARNALRGLSESGLLLPSSSTAGMRYQFKHALVHELAANSMLKSARSGLHARAARLLEASTGLRASNPEVLAHHYCEAQEYEQAVACWTLAGKAAAARLAHIEARNHFEHALHWLPQCAPGPERSRNELALCVALGAVLATIKGYAATDVEHMYARAAQLCSDVEDAELACAALRGQCQLTLLQGRYGEARALADKLLVCADRLAVRPQSADAHMMLGKISIFEGRLRESVDQFELALAQLDADGYRQYGASNGIDLTIGCLAFEARAQWLLGRYDTAFRCADEALAQAERPAVWLGAVQASGMRALLHQGQGDVEWARHYAEQTVQRAHEQVIPYWEALGEIIKAWADARDGGGHAALKQVEEGGERYRIAGGRLGSTWVMSVLAEVQRTCGGTAAALATLARALEHARQTGEMYFLPELWRMRGELLAATSRQAESAEKCFLAALQCADSMHARAWRVRTIASLAKFWCERDRVNEAAALLKQALAGAEEKDDSADTRQALKLRAMLGVDSTAGLSAFR